MHIDIRGRVQNTKLPVKHSLLPLFEAVVNSVHAINAAPNGTGEIRVRVDRALTLGLSDEGSRLPDVTGFTVEDTGIGFTETNFESFDTMDSRAKAALGGKGVGRLLWLKAFASADITSTYEDGGKWFRRHFQFRLTAAGIEDHEIQPLESASARSTSVRLVGFHEEYRNASPKSTVALARRIVEHCLQFYLLDAMPPVTLSDPDGDAPEIRLADLYRNEMKPTQTNSKFYVGRNEFVLRNVLLKTSERDHALLYCAHDRVVDTRKLRSAIPHLDQSLSDDDGHDVTYWGCVMGRVLDDRVNAQRTGFDIDRYGDLPFEGGITMDELDAAAVTAAEEFLAPRTAAAKENSIARVRQFVEEKEPKYRPLLDHRREEVERLSGSLSDEGLDLELHKISAEWRRDVKTSVSRRLAQLPEDPEAFKAHHARFTALIGELADVAKSDLAEYVLNRASVLSFFEKLLARLESGKFPKEDAVHELFFPLRTTSDEIEFDQHNLWMLDERLAYHQYLASDLPFRKQAGAPADIDSADRPDILIYNQAHALTPGSAPFGSVVIVEFKRPERADYSGEDNPVEQALRYVDLIRSGKARRKNGSTIERVPEQTPFYCHIVATLTESLREIARVRGFTETPDADGYFMYNAPMKSFIEISSYRKVLTDAKKRNKAFFDQLQLPVR